MSKFFLKLDGRSLTFLRINHNKLNVTIEEKPVNPTNKQAQVCLRVCQNKVSMFSIERSHLRRANKQQLGTVSVQE
ncbi:hypothetical protein [Myxosarcina sp. GI1]|uniref:hypothetical protein n=1 Tax=Myxosarcina sp. GI1 TaxID=1541065 RepID=UPI0012E019BF|nr:hypothetical protein [Myxosarcina sp. GI1]